MWIELLPMSSRASFSIRSLPILPHLRKLRQYSSKPLISGCFLSMLGSAVRGRGHRQPDKKLRASTGQAFYGDCPAVTFHEVLHDGQPQAGPAQLTGPCLVHPVEAFEDPRPM